jgi:hypothetical protein
MNAQYGFIPGRKVGRVPHVPSAEEVNIRVRAQSLLTVNGRLGPLLPTRDAKRVIAMAESGHKPRVTVPANVQPSAHVSDPPIGCDPLNRAARSDGSGDYSEGEAA